MAKNVIWAGPADGACRSPLTEEGLAVQALLPGSLVAVDASGMDYSAAAATVDTDLLVVREIGENYGKAITDAWTISENAIAVRPRSGEFVNVRLAASQSVVYGSPLTSNGDGTFKIATPATDVVHLYAREAVTTGVGETTTLVRAIR